MASESPGNCRHCAVKNAWRRGLCHRCYWTPGLRGRYPCTDKYNQRGLCPDGALAPQRLPAQPTTAYPGTAEKVAVLEQRARAGQQLWHPLDARYVPDYLSDDLGSFNLDDGNSDAGDEYDPR